MNIVPPELRNRLNIRKDEVRGHYGNPIKILRIEIAPEKDAELIVKYIAQMLSNESKETIKATFPLRVDENGTLYLRLDKQKAYNGKIALDEGSDVIKIRIRLKRVKDKSYEEICRLLGLIP